MRPLELFALFWLGFAASWIAAGVLWRSKPTHTVTGPRVWLYRFLLVGGGVLLNYWPSYRLHLPRLWHVGLRGADILACLTLVGFAFAWWGRIHLGSLWSGAVTRKPDHRVVNTGPYRLVRHPIYTGILFACLVSAIAAATWLTLLGFVAIVAGFWTKARLEEGFLTEELGPDYAAYSRHTPMLMPFWPKQA
jgi:protein-S-isoprenylcysteine O-methyltransferase Ste14